MINIKFQSGVNQQPIFSGLCTCGNMLTFTPGRDAVCPLCGRRWATKVEATEQPPQRVKAEPFTPQEKKKRGNGTIE